MIVDWILTPLDIRRRYYSIDAIFNKCGETCLDPRTYALYKVFEPGLKRAASPSQEVSTVFYSMYFFYMLDS